MSSYNEFRKKLLKMGCRELRNGEGSCVMMISPTGKIFPFHSHGAKEMSRDLQIRMLKEAGLK